MRRAHNRPKHPQYKEMRCYKEAKERVRGKDEVRWICIVTGKVEGMSQDRKLICCSNKINNQGMPSEMVWMSGKKSSTITIQRTEVVELG